ncbi:hypothetical protein BCV72DRAFT_339020 [Rhizopus microsporus var. microsporus]|uniref:Uncharacterized protein n=2 Tax=Rhizopus microsporus TaxID=58291 RepID=A0A2G4SPI9_RHIZD|nr:uncharacterized protein RHIMIDRAFT_293462 [Rhizopus microsporus ATCC 52813]ORE02011.1 hypothetical protein BCV72DRAFT_339020 [Rhizopus microsporus var. microsporus]PHZ10680.1 hypothetical protein RHIMIDRAFT_293462 [Rhizopus microsporus ATCC 52813]
MSYIIMDSSQLSTSNLKRSKKPKPLFGIFRTKTNNKQSPSSTSPLGSGLSSAPIHSLLSPSLTTDHSSSFDPYAPPPLRPLPKPSMSDTRRPLFSPQFPPRQLQQQQQQQQQNHQQQRRPRSKSVGRDPSVTTRLLNEREMALNKLCQKELNNPQSLVDSLPLLSSTVSKPPPVPPIPVEHQSAHTMRKFSSAHDLRKTARLQQEALDKLPPPPVPKTPTTPKIDLSRSKSLNSYKLHPSKSHQHLNSKYTKWPNTATAATFPIQYHSNSNSDEDDDDIPLGFLQSPISRPSSLLNDEDEDDDIDLIPIAKLNQDVHNYTNNTNNEEYLTAADKYKEKVKERLQLDDDNTPISLSLTYHKF